VRKVFLLFFLACFIGLACLGLLRHGATPSAPASSGAASIYKIAGEDYGHPSPYAFYPRGPGYCRMSLVFDTLVWKDQKGIIPWLSKSYQMAAGGKEWTFNLNPKAKWQDGQPLTAEDVKFTFDYIKQHPHPWFSRELAVVSKVEAKDKDKVVIFLKEPYAPFLTNIAGTIPIMPKHIWSKVADPLKYNDAKAAIGSGPFKLVKYDKANALYVFQANQDYFKGKVKVDKLIFLQTGQPLMALTKGDIDAFEPNVDQKIVLEKNKNIKVMEGSGFWIYRLLFNLEQQPWQEVKFRQAIAYALNLPDLVKRAMHNGAKTGKPGYVSPELAQWYNAKTLDYPYSPQKANEILDGLGYKDNNGDGIREMPGGKKLSFQLLTFQEGQDGEIIKSMLKDVGIEIQIKALDKGAHDSLIADKQYQIAINGHGGIGGDPVFLNQLIASPKATQQPSSDMFKDEEYTRLAKAQSKMTDQRQRKQIVNRMQEILAEKLPTLPLYYRQMYFAYKPGKVDGWFFTSGGIASGIPTELNKVVFLKL